METTDKSNPRELPPLFPTKSDVQERVREYELRIAEIKRRQSDSDLSFEDRWFLHQARQIFEDALRQCFRQPKMGPVR